MNDQELWELGYQHSVENYERDKRYANDLQYKRGYEEAESDKRFAARGAGIVCHFNQHLKINGRLVHRMASGDIWGPPGQCILDPDPQARIVIEISGGNLQGVYRRKPDGEAGPVGEEYVLVDWDNIRDGDELNPEDLAACSNETQKEYAQVVKG